MASQGSVENAFKGLNIHSKRREGPKYCKCITMPVFQTLCAPVQDVREPEIWQTGNIPVDTLKKEVGRIFHNGVLVQPHLLNNEVVKVQVTQGAAPVLMFSCSIHFTQV